MYPYITCFCGISIGDLADAFKAMRLAKIQKLLGKEDTQIKPEFIRYNEDIQIDVKDILDALLIEHDCCRLRLMSQAEMSEFK